METLREDLEILIKELGQNQPKEYSTGINLDSQGNAIHLTDTISGFIKYIIVETELITANLRIIREKYRSFLILEDKSLSGNKVYFPKHINVSTDSTLLDFDGGQYSEIPIPNDRLEISIQGGLANSQIKFTIVYL